MTLHDDISRAAANAMPSTFGMSTEVWGDAVADAVTALPAMQAREAVIAAAREWAGPLPLKVSNLIAAVDDLEAAVAALDALEAEDG